MKTLPLHTFIIISCHSNIDITQSTNVIKYQNPKGEVGELDYPSWLVGKNKIRSVHTFGIPGKWIFWIESEDETGKKIFSDIFCLFAEKPSDTYEDPFLFRTTIKEAYAEIAGKSFFNGGIVWFDNIDRYSTAKPVVLKGEIFVEGEGRFFQGYRNTYGEATGAGYIKGYNLERTYLDILSSLVGSAIVSTEKLISNQVIDSHASMYGQCGILSEAFLASTKEFSSDLLGASLISANHNVVQEDTFIHIAGANIEGAAILDTFAVISNTQIGFADLIGASLLQSYSISSYLISSQPNILAAGVINASGVSMTPGPLYGFLFGRGIINDTGHLVDIHSGVSNLIGQALLSGFHSFSGEHLGHAGWTGTGNIFAEHEFVNVIGYTPNISGACIIQTHSEVTQELSHLVQIFGSAIIQSEGRIPKYIQGISNLFGTGQTNAEGYSNAYRYAGVKIQASGYIFVDSEVGISIVSSGNLIGASYLEPTVEKSLVVKSYVLASGQCVIQSQFEYSFVVEVSHSLSAKGLINAWAYISGTTVNYGYLLGHGLINAQSSLGIVRSGYGSAIGKALISVSANFVYIENIYGTALTQADALAYHIYKRREDLVGKGLMQTSLHIFRQFLGTVDIKGQGFAECDFNVYATHKIGQAVLEGVSEITSEYTILANFVPVTSDLILQSIITAMGQVTQTEESIGEVTEVHSTIYDIKLTDTHIFVYTDNANTNLNLPKVSLASGREYHIQKSFIGYYSITINSTFLPSGKINLNGVLGKGLTTISNQAWIKVKSDGEVWQIIEKSGVWDLIV